MLRILRNKEEKRRGWLLDAALAALVGILSAAACLVYLESRSGTPTPRYIIDENLLRPAVFLALGKGFEDYGPSSVYPGLDDFVRQRQASWTPREEPNASGPLGTRPFFRAHRYLLYVIAAAWRVFGFSWRVVSGLVAAFAGVAGAAVYGLFRLGMRRWISVLGATLFMITPGVLRVAPAIRDFGKAPFILAALFLMGCLLSRTTRRSQLLGLSALLGMVIGVGLGFRTDLLIFVLPASMAIACCPLADMAGFVRYKLLAIACFLACFLVPAWPILRTMNEGGGTLAHYLIQGLCAECEERMEIVPASYEYLYSYDDHIVHATENSFDRRCSAASLSAHAAQKPMSFFSAEAEQAGRRLLWKTAGTFPADVITRIYGATLRLIRGATFHAPVFDMETATFKRDPMLMKLTTASRPLARHLHRFGPCYALAVLLIIAGSNVRLAWVTLLLLLFCCGYTCILFQPRHVFPAGFVALWFPALLADNALIALVATARGIKNALKKSPQSDNTPSAASPARPHPSSFILLPSRFILRASVFFILPATLVLGMPLLAARAYQSRNVDHLIEQYRTADLVPVATKPEPQPDGWTLFRMTERLSVLDCSPNTPEWEVPAAYLAADFAGIAFPQIVWVRYEGNTIGSNNSHLMVARPARKGDPGVIRCFFPVYETAIHPMMSKTPPAEYDPKLPWERTRFVGVSLPTGMAERFKGLYWVRNADTFPLFLHASVPPDPTFFRRCQSLSLIP